MRSSAIAIVLFMSVAIAVGGSPDDDLDGVPNDLDCRPDDGTLWAPPAESINDLTVTLAGSVAVLNWSTPSDIGGDPGTERYDTYGTRVPDAFGHATGYCVDLDGASLTASDDRALLPGEVAHYLVRIENDCGPGPIGTDPPPAEPRSLNYIVVDNTNDTGPGSLREAIGLAQAGDAICVNATGTIDLTTGTLTVDKDIAIVGPGSDLLTVTSSSSGFVVLELGDTAAACSGVTIDGNAQTYYGIGMNGGATLESMAIQNSSVGVQRGNSGSLGSPASIRSSSIENNWHGVWRSSGGELTIVASTISGNTTGVRNGWSYQPLTITSSTIHSNQTGFYETYGRYTTIDSSTISANSTGLRLTLSGWVTLQSSTISGNTTGLHLIDGPVRVQNTIWSNSSNCYFYYYESLTSQGHNLFSDSSCDGAGATGDQVGVDPLLGPLADNGGPTETHLPLTGSPVIDAGSCADSTRDRRGFPRPVDNPGTPNVDDGCDIGAVEKR